MGLFDFFKKQKDTSAKPIDKLTPYQKAFQNPFISKAIDFISAGQTLPEAEAYQKNQIDAIKRIPGIIARETLTATNPIYPFLHLKESGKDLKSISDLSPMSRTITSTQRAIPEIVSGNISSVPKEAWQGFIRPDLTPAGYIGGEARKLFPAPQQEESMFSPANITSALLGTTGDIAAAIIGTGQLPEMVKQGIQSIKTKGAFRTGEKLVDDITESILKKRHKMRNTTEISKDVKNIRATVRKAILGSEKPTEITKPGVGEALYKKQTPKKLTSDWVKSVKKALASEAGEKKIITDPAKIQQIKNSISEGEMILKSGKNIAGQVMSKGALEAVKRSVDSAKEKIGIEVKETLKEKPVVKAESEKALIEEAKKYDTVEGFIKSQRQEYKGQHEAPNRSDGYAAEGHDLKDIYPDDIYSSKGAIYYGHGEPLIDNQSISIISGMRGNPKQKVTIYRAIPSTKTNTEMISMYEDQKKKILKNGKIPDYKTAKAYNLNNSSEYYDFIDNEIRNLQGKNDPAIIQQKINPGDWVTINRKYAIQHGQSTLNNNYKILKKTVRADEIFTDGNSIHEWGYDPKIGWTKTESQLTDIWNKAHKPPKPPKKPPVAAGTPEEPEPMRKITDADIPELPKPVLSKSEVKPTIRKATGQPQIEPKTISEKKALEVSLKRQEKVTKKAFKVGEEEGKMKVREVLKRSKERKELSAEVKRLIKNIQSKPTKDLPIEYKDAIEEIKNNIDFEKVRLSNILKREKALKLVDEDVRESAKELASINAEDMTLADLQEVEDLVSQIYHSGVHEHRFLQNEIRMDFDKAVIQATEQIKTKNFNKEVIPLEKILKEETFESRIKRIVNQYLYENRRPEAIFEELDNYKEGVFTKVVWDPTIKGFYKYHTDLENFIKDVKEIALKIKGKNVGEKSIAIPGMKRKITISDAMAVYAHSQNSANKAHLKAMGFTQEMIDSVINQLKPEFKKVVDEIIDYLTKNMFPLIDKTNVALTGTHLNLIDRYFPIINLLDNGSVESVKMDLNARTQYKRSGIYKSFVKEREVVDKSTKAFKKLDFFSTLYQHINNVAYYINMSEPIRDASKFLFNPTVKASIREIYGDSLNRVNKKWIDDVTTNRLPYSSNIFETIVDTIGKNAVMYFIGSSLSVAIKQIASFLQGLGYIGEANAMSGLLQVTTNPMAVLKFASNRSTLIRTRVKFFSQERDFQEIFGGKSAAGRFGVKDTDIEISQKVKEVSMMPVQIMDMSTVLAIWKGAYDSQIAKNVNIEDAIKYADKAIRRTQPMGGIVNLPETFRGNVLMRQITRLKNQPSQNINLMYDFIKKFARSNKEFKDFKEFGSHAFWWFLAPAVMWGMLSRKRLQRDKKEVSQDLLNFGLGGLPFLGQLLSAYITPYYDSDLLNSFLSKIKGIRGGRTKEKRIKSSLETIGISIGVPGGASIVRAFYGKDLQQKILGGESQATRMKYQYMDALRETDKTKRLSKIKEINRKVKNKGLSISKVSKDAKSWLRGDLRDQYKIEGNIDDIKNIRIIRKMPKEERAMLIRTYSASSQEKIRDKL